MRLTCIFVEHLWRSVGHEDLYLQKIDVMLCEMRFAFGIKFNGMHGVQIISLTVPLRIQRKGFSHQQNSNQIGVLSNLKGLILLPNTSYISFYLLLEVTPKN